MCETARRTDHPRPQKFSCTHKVNIQLNLMAVPPKEDGIWFKATCNSNIVSSPVHFETMKSPLRSCSTCVCVFTQYVHKSVCLWGSFIDSRQEAPAHSRLSPSCLCFQRGASIKDFLLSGFEKEPCSIEPTILSQKSGLLFVCAKVFTASVREKWDYLKKRCYLSVNISPSSSSSFSPCSGNKVF